MSDPLRRTADGRLDMAQFPDEDVSLDERRRLRRILRRDLERPVEWPGRPRVATVRGGNPLARTLLRAAAVLLPIVAFAAIRSGLDANDPDVSPQFSSNSEPVEGQLAMQTLGPIDRGDLDWFSEASGVDLPERVVVRSDPSRQDAYVIETPEGRQIAVIYSAGVGWAHAGGSEAPGIRLGAHEIEPPMAVFGLDPEPVGGGAWVVDVDPLGDVPLMLLPATPRPPVACVHVAPVSANRRVC